MSTKTLATLHANFWEADDYYVAEQYRQEALVAWAAGDHQGATDPATWVWE